MDLDDKGDGVPKRPPMQRRTDRFFVETETYRRVMDAVETGETPALVLGPGGSGKTTLLRAVADEWARSDRKVVFLSLYEIGRADDLLLLLRRQITDAFRLPPSEESDVVSGSSRAALRATVEVIESVRSELLLVFDGLDEVRESSPVIQLLEQLSSRRSRRTRVVVSSRRRPIISLRAFRSVFELSSLTASEVAEFVRLSGFSEFDSAKIDYIIDNSGGLPLAISLMLPLINSKGIPLDFHVPAPREEQLLQLVMRAIKDVGQDGGAEFTKALIALAVLKRPVSSLEYPAKLLLDLEKSGLLSVSSEAGVAIVHSLVAEVILAEAKLTEDCSDLALSILEFGAEEAERDALLSDSFITLPEFSELLAAKRNIVIGDRGTGKSAMFARLSLPFPSESTFRVPLIKALTHPADMLRRLEANGSQLSTADQFRAGWLTLVAYCIADQVKTFSSAGHARAALYLKEMLGNESQPSWMFLKFFKSLGERILKSGVKIKLGPVEIDPAGKPASKTGSSIELREFIKDAATSLASSGQRALITLDRVDEIHKYDRDLQQKAVQGLFLAEGDLAQLIGIRLVIFLRSDLFKIYDIQEKNKLVSRSMSISWTKVQLVQFLVDRVLSNPCLEKVRRFVASIPDTNHDVAMAAIFPSEIEGMAVTEWLWEWMENGNGDVTPRQIILLLILAAQSPVAQKATMSKLPIFPSAALQWGMDQLSELSFKELVDDFRVAPTFLANCRADRMRSFELGKVETLFNEDEGSVSVQVERLERLGFLERVVLQNPDGTKSSQFEVPKLFTRSWGVA